ncbi:hypothetical protein MTO96_039328 [Rhipicephalus appendiculatus]
MRQRDVYERLWIFRAQNIYNCDTATTRKVQVPAKFSAACSARPHPTESNEQVATPQRRSAGSASSGGSRAAVVAVAAADGCTAEASRSHRSLKRERSRLTPSGGG